MPSEETYITGLNRYPDPHQHALKQLICNLRNSQSDPSGTLTPANLFCGVGSDEAIDAVMRIFCRPGRDKLMICSPTYGMYKVSATINEVTIIDVPLIEMTWQLDIDNVSPI
jgi:histidinol-phosphate aminotransferase